MKRYLLPALFLLVLVTPFVLRQVMGTAPAPAASAGAVPLNIITANAEQIRREFADAFSDWHRAHFGQPVDVHYMLFGGASDIVKYFDAARATYAQTGTYQIDLVWGGGDFLFEQQLKKPGYLQPLSLPRAVMEAAYPKPDLGGLALYDRGTPPCWFGTALSGFGICFNRDVVRYLGLADPKTWRDLADPHYAGWVMLADPTRSASAKAAYLAVVERAMADASAAGRSEDQGWANGMGLLRQISANARGFTDSSSTLPNLVSSGDVAVAMTIDFYARSQVAAVASGRMGYVEPTNATVIAPDPIALVKGAPHREVAEHFIQFVLSEDGQRLWKQKPGTPGGPRHDALWREPIMPRVYDLPASELTDQTNPFHEVFTFNKSNAREQTFSILGELMQFSCMDVLEELRETRKQILAAGRADLDARLGTFPFGQAEALRRAKIWHDATAVERLELGRKWTGEFEEEYRALREAAEKNIRT